MEVVVDAETIKTSIVIIELNTTSVVAMIAVAMSVVDMTNAIIIVVEAVAMVAKIPKAMVAAMVAEAVRFAKCAAKLAI
jgi:hypothetical protein